MRSRQLRILAGVFIAACAVFLALAVLYFSTPANDLPSLLGRVKGTSQHRVRRGDAAVLLTLISWIGAIVCIRARRHRQRRRPPRPSSETVLAPPRDRDPH